MAQESDREAANAAVVRLLREERERQEISMTVLAERSGLSQAAMSLVERGLRNPTLDTLLRIAEVLEVELGAILTRATRESRRRSK